jgi:hypothetical protein
MFKSIMGQYVPSCITAITLLTSFSSYATTNTEEHRSSVPNHYLSLEKYKELTLQQQTFFVVGVHDSMVTCTPNISGSQLVNNLNTILLTVPKEFNDYPAARAVKNTIGILYKCTET